MNNKSKISAAALERKFDADENLDAHVDWSKVRVVRPKVRKVKVEVPENWLKSLDREAARLGVTREALIRFWIGQHLARPA